jgi:hypothetical protein
MKNIALRYEQSGNIRRAMVALCLDLGGPARQFGALGLLARGLQPAYGTHVSGFGILQPYNAGVKRLRILVRNNTRSSVTSKRGRVDNKS